jgi:hypothetical protein
MNLPKAVAKSKLKKSVMLALSKVGVVITEPYLALPYKD